MEGERAEGGLSPAEGDTRTILVHLNIQAPRTDTRSADEIGDAVMGAVEVGSDNEALEGLEINLALADAID
jgi:hypothetical protein